MRHFGEGRIPSPVHFNLCYNRKGSPESARGSLSVSVSVRLPIYFICLHLYTIPSVRPSEESILVAIAHPLLGASEYSCGKQKGRYQRREKRQFININKGRSTCSKESYECSREDDVQALGAPVGRVPESERASGSSGTSAGTRRRRSSGVALAGWLAAVAALHRAPASRWMGVSG